MKVMNLIVAGIMLLSSFAYADIDSSAKASLQEDYGNIPLYFIQNEGQVDKRVKYYEKGSGHSTFFTKEGVHISLQAPNNKKINLAKDRSARSEATALKSEVVKLIPVNANKSPEIVAEGAQEGKVNYFIGNDSKKWKTDIPTYKAVVYKELYKGIDMKFYGNNRQMEYDIIVKPGADPSKVRLSYEGIKVLSLTKDGDLEIALNEGKIIQKKPYVYQEIGGKRVEVEGKFKITPSPLVGEGRGEGKFSYGFHVAAYNKDHPLIIDPVLAYSTYLGGSGSEDGFSIAIDGAGNAYVSGRTNSTDFPTANPAQGSNGGNYDAFVTKINASGTAIIYSTYLGGSSSEWAETEVDSSGNAYVAGTTWSSNFPMLNPIQGTSGGGQDVFVAKLDATGTLAYSTYLGGSSEDLQNEAGIDASGNVYVTGRTSSSNFPTVNPIQAVKAGGYYDAFVTKINASGTAISYSTYLGGSGEDMGWNVAVDAAGNAYVAGETYSTDFPTVNPIYGTNGGDRDAFVTKINPSGTAISYSTYLGGSGSDTVISIAVDASGNAYITGEAGSTNFPTVNPIQAANAGGTDAFIAKINAPGTGLVYSTYLGGSGFDGGWGIGINGSGDAYISGYTESSNFPTASPIQGKGSLAGSSDAFVAKINSGGTSLLYSTYLGGSGAEYSDSIAVSSIGDVYVSGNTSSVDFPTANPIQGSLSGSQDAFVVKISPAVSGCITLKGYPIAGSAVSLKQTGSSSQNTSTNSEGCYIFDTAVSGKSFTVTINGPVVP